jgi:probable HAF family extracellular repeat protein
VSVFSGLGLGAESARRGPIGWCRHAEGARRERDDVDGVARHVEELDRVAFFSDTRHDVPLHNRADVASAQTVFAVGGNKSVALGINRAGHVVGFAETADGRTHAFVYLKTGLIDLGTFGGDESYAHRISDGDLIVGRARSTDGDFRPFVSSATGQPREG